MQLPKRQFAVWFFALISQIVGLSPLAGLTSHPALAQVPRPWEMDMQPAFSPMKQGIIDLHNLVLVLITVVTIFVAGLLAWVCYRFNEKRNPVPSQTSHHTGLEIAWTVLPVLILVVMAIPSFRLIYYLDRTPNPDMTIKVTGHQWYWEYTYPDNGGVDVESRYVHDEDLKPGQLRLLAVELWLEADKPGVYYGECNQICGQDHSKMPIAVHAVTEAEFKTWVEQAKKNAGVIPPNPNVLAVAARTDTGNVQR